MAGKILNTVVSSSRNAMRRKRPGFHNPLATCHRSLASTNTVPLRTINHQVVDDIKAYPPTLLQYNGPKEIKNVNKEDEVKPLSHAYVGMTGGQIFHEMMLQHGVKYIFGYPGGAILPVFDALHESPAMDFFLVKHEQGAGHMAEGYARASGRPGIVVVTSGPGATNLITPLQDALMDGTPMIAFCGQVPTFDLGKDSFQEADVMGLARACTKWCVQPQSVDDLPRCINEAFEAATTGRPGPVLVDLPKDVTASILGSSLPLTPPKQTTFTRDEPLLDSQELAATIARAATLLNNAKKPVIYAGQGIMSHPDGPVLLNQLSQKATIPVTTTLLGLGAYDENDPKSLHMLGMHGSCYANLAMQEADVIIALGARFDDRITRKLDGFAPEAHKAAAEGRGGIIHFEIFPHNMNKVVKAKELIPGDVVENLAEFVQLTEEVSSRPEWLAQIAEWKEMHPWAYEKEGDDGVVKPQSVIAMLDELTAEVKDNTVIATGVGAHQMFAAQHYRWRSPRSMITSGGLGTMGFGLPAAIGAKIARPDALVVDVDGDSSFGMTMTELTTAKCYNIGVKVLILNNNEQGMVTHSQQMFFNDRYAHTHGTNVDFVKFGEAAGVQADRVETISELREKLHWLLFETGDSTPALLEVMVDQKVPILPIVLPGTALHEFVPFNEERERARRVLTRERSGR
ncbi:probable thiamine pyrophosphate-requiring enzyme [Ramularia collo-cygni]|uniref:Acetolactate synthase n=1 Tax=Ramularia collo-cygni TaxID=112498 RepID=A0A2D3V0E1_9PEZI|nr:probable thiamine pyrophosphate-requiring enzyme [Ramularia collo-cygni]CZT18137.1 probable thiamine pyrophosphate-requiring enzyme [Ramularia collo-cygni]